MNYNNSCSKCKEYKQDIIKLINGKYFLNKDNMPGKEFKPEVGTPRYPYLCRNCLFSILYKDIFLFNDYSIPFTDIYKMETSKLHSGHFENKEIFLKQELRRIENELKYIQEEKLKRKL